MDIDSLTIVGLKKELSTRGIDYSYCKLKSDYYKLLKEDIEKKDVEENEEEEKEEEKEENKEPIEVYREEEKEKEEKTSVENKNKRKLVSEEPRNEPPKKPATSITTPITRQRRQATITALDKNDRDMEDYDDDDDEEDDDEEEEMVIEKPSKKLSKKKPAGASKSKTTVTKTTPTKGKGKNTGPLPTPVSIPTEIRLLSNPSQTTNTTTTTTTTKQPHAIPPFKEGTSHSERLFWRIFRNIVLKRKILNLGVEDLEIVQRYDSIFNARWLLLNNHLSTVIDFVKNGRYLYWQFRFGCSSSESLCDYEILSTKNIEDQEFFETFYRRYKHLIIYVSNTPQLSQLIKIPQIFLLLVKDKDVKLPNLTYHNGIDFIYNNFSTFLKSRPEMIEIEGSKYGFGETEKLSVENGVKLGYANKIVPYLIDNSIFNYKAHRNSFSAPQIYTLPKEYIIKLIDGQCVDTPIHSTPYSSVVFPRLDNFNDNLKFTVKNLKTICFIQSYCKKHFNNNSESLKEFYKEFDNQDILESDETLIQITNQNEKVKQLFEFYLDNCNNCDVSILLIYCCKYENVKRFKDKISGGASLKDKGLIFNNPIIIPIIFMNLPILRLVISLIEIYENQGRGEGNENYGHNGTNPKSIIYQNFDNLSFQPLEDNENEQIEFIKYLVENVSSSFSIKQHHKIFQEIINFNNLELFKLYTNLLPNYIKCKFTEKTDHFQTIKFPNFQLFEWFFLNSKFSINTIVMSKEFQTGYDLIDILSKDNYQEYFNLLVTKRNEIEKFGQIIEHTGSDLSRFKYFSEMGYRVSHKYFKDSIYQRPHIAAYLISNEQEPTATAPLRYSVNLTSEYCELPPPILRALILRSEKSSKNHFKISEQFKVDVYRTSLIFSNNHDDIEINEDNFNLISPKYIGHRGNLESIRKYMSIFYPKVESTRPNVLKIGNYRSKVLLELLKGISLSGNLLALQMLYQEFNHVFKLLTNNRGDPYSSQHLIKKVQIQLCLFETIKVRAFELSDFFLNNIVIPTGRQLAEAARGNIISIIYVANTKDTKAYFNSSQLSKINKSGYTDIIPKSVMDTTNTSIAQKRIRDEKKIETLRLHHQNSYFNFNHHHHHHHHHFTDSDDDSDDDIFGIFHDHHNPYYDSDDDFNDSDDDSDDDMMYPQNGCSLM